MSIKRTREILQSDLDPDFVESIAIGLGWEYSDLYDRLANDVLLIDGYREEEFNKQRGACAIRVLARAASQHGVPFDYRRLECNGQHKLLIKAGRVIIVQEPILTEIDHPKVADYKIDLADLHGFVRQLELDLDDQPLRIRDWSGCVFAVLLHAPAGMKFTRDHKALGRVMLGVPDGAYQEWVVRLDLHSIASFGRGNAEPESPTPTDSGVQTDNVVVTPKRKNSSKDVV